MNAFASLTNRIFFATALLAVLSISVAVYVVNRAVTQREDQEIQRSIEQAKGLVDHYRNFTFDAFGRDARFIAEIPMLQAAVDTHNPETVKPLAEEYQPQFQNADLFAIADNTGRVLVRLGTSDVPDEALTAATVHGHGATADRDVFWPQQHGVMLLKSVPMPGDIGTLILGASLDHRLASQFAQLTNSEIAFGINGAIKAATLPEETWPALSTLLAHPGTSTHITLNNGEEYQAFPRPLAPSAVSGQPMGIVLVSQTQQRQFLNKLHQQLAAVAVVAVLVAILFSYAIARTVTRPLGAITTTMREMAASGDLTRRIPVPPNPRWQDEDARLLATTFNSLTGSIERFQREATQRERLSSLGRLSTVVAHEIRNPLMIIKTALRSLRRDDAAPEQVQGAARDIDEEVTRLNRIVTEVLDFARPIKFELAPASLNLLAEDAVRAASAADGHTAVRLDLDPAVPAMRTDGERLRQVLVNVLGNAMQAVAAATPETTDNASISLRTSRVDPRHVLVTVADRGVGIAPEDLPRVFDPYFTTRRTGTGIGLAISRNIIEGLGGRITVSSERDRGTEVRIELPVDAPMA
jgi:signal transduction histidine kinase